MIKSGTITFDYADLIIEDFSLIGEMNGLLTTPRSGDYELINYMNRIGLHHTQKRGLVSRVKSETANKMALWVDGYGAELSLLGNGAWQRFNLPLASFKNSLGESLSSWARRSRIEAWG